MDVDRRFGAVRTLDKGHSDRTLLVLAHAPIEKISRIQRMIIDVELGRELLPGMKNFDVDMRSATGIRHGLDGAEGISSIWTGQHMTKALESLISVHAAAIARVQVAPVGIALPDFNASPRNGFPPHDPKPGPSK